jgi:succinate dehydrogenase flavin-adding protein (antitoxin of CptAB toxin-antitoxin module)
MKKLLPFILALLFISCSNEGHDLTVKANIKGLKKGSVYLKKVQDTALVTVDSIVINGNSEFELHSKLESPEVFFLYLDKNSNENDRIRFFADKGITEINTTLKNFSFDAKINGSKQQKTLEEYQLMMSRFNEKNLNLIKENFEAQKEGDTSRFNSIQKEYDNLLKRKYLYTVNFALNNKDSEVAPYLALTEIYNAQIKYLDTINVSLTPEVKNSKYGKELQLFVDNIKKEDAEK